MIHAPNADTSLTGAVSFFIAGDWGTSNLRLYFCRMDDGGRVELLDECAGPGVGHCDDFESTLFALCKPWLHQHGCLPILLSGMVGSTLGWRAAPYLDCPAAPQQISQHTLQFSVRGHDVTIVPGLRCINPLGDPDVMRGEEIQVLGWLASVQDAANGDSLLCLPGTHSKWVGVSGGIVQSFMTGLTGEMFAALAQHSVLLKNVPAVARPGPAFDAGVDAAQDSQLLHRLFSVRSRQLAKTLAPDDAASYLSGMLIGADLAGARVKLDASQRIVLIGAPTLTALYAAALERLGEVASSLDGASACLSGYAWLARLARQ